MNIFQELSQYNEESDFDVLEDANPSQEGQNVFYETAAKNKVNQEVNSFGFLDTLKDIGQQAIKGIATGFTSAAGNILDVVGLSIPEGKLTPGEEQINKIQFDLLAKQERGEPLSYGEMMLLSDDDYGIRRLPTSNQSRQALEDLTGVGKGKTPTGRVVGKGAEFVGEGIATGGGLKSLATLALSGAGGQTLREVGAPEGLASGFEIASSIVPSLISGKLIGNKKNKDIIKAGRNVGLTEKQITPLIQGEAKAATLSKAASKGEKTKNSLKSINDSLGDAYQEIKNNVSGFGKIPSQQQSNLIQKFSDISVDLKKTLKPSPDKEAAIKFIEEATDKLSRGTNPEELINFWQDINKSVRWNSIQGGKKAIAKMKEPILETLKSTVPEAAARFEDANLLYGKYKGIAKQLKPGAIDSLLGKAQILAIPTTAAAMITGTLSPGTALALGGSKSAMSTLSREMLINPYFQDISKKMVKNFNQGSLKGLTSSVSQVKEYMQRKHPDEDWDFLTED